MALLLESHASTRREEKYKIDTTYYTKINPDPSGRKFNFKYEVLLYRYGYCISLMVLIF